MNKHDLRWIKTEALIKESFRHCVKKDGLEGTKVSDICAYARISRNTFYAHYEDKYGLLDHLFREFEERCTDRIQQKMIAEIRKNHIRNAVKWYLDIVEEDGALFSLLMECAPQRFMEVLRQEIIHVPMRMAVDRYDAQTENAFAQLNIEYMLYGMIGFTKCWLEHADSVSKEEAVEQLETLCREAVRAYNEKIR